MDSFDNNKQPIDFNITPEWGDKKTDEQIQIDVIDELFIEDSIEDNLIDKNNEFVSVDVDVISDYNDYSKNKSYIKKPKTKTIGICAFVIGIYSIVLCINFSVLGIVLGTIAIILALIAIAKITGRAFGYAGLFFGIIGTVLGIFLTSNLFSLYKDAEKTYSIYSSGGDYSVTEFFKDLMDVYDIEF